jgi:predicted cupin superfamily sugar epimerase
VRPTVEEIAAQLGLEPHREGGWFRETYRATETVATACGSRATSTAILFLVSVSSPSRFHRLASDELWVFQAGLPLELVTLDADGAANVRLLGDPAAAHAALPQALVPAGAWQAARVAGVAGGASALSSPVPDAPPSTGERAWSLVSCVVTPGFTYEDFALAERAELVRLCPAQAELIVALT